MLVPNLYLIMRLAGERVVLTESTTESVDVVFNSGQQAPRGRGGSSQKREEVDKIQVS